MALPRPEAVPALVESHGTAIAGLKAQVEGLTEAIATVADRVADLVAVAERLHNDQEYIAKMHLQRFHTRPHVDNADQEMERIAGVNGNQS